MKIIPFCAALAPAIMVLRGGPAPTAPAQAQTVIVSPVAAAKTFQVTETVYRVKRRDRLGPLIGPLSLAETMTVQVTRPYKFRTVRFRALTRTVCVSDGKTITYSSGGKTRKGPAGLWESPEPLTRLLNLPKRVPVTAAVRHGRSVLIAAQSLGGGSRLETFYGLKSQMPLEETLFFRRQGKVGVFMRTVYSGWVLNGPIAPSVFRP